MITAVIINTHETCDKYLTSLTHFFSVPLVNENEYCYTPIQQPSLSYSVYHRRLQCMSESASAVRYCHTVCPLCKLLSCGTWNHTV